MCMAYGFIYFPVLENIRTEGTGYRWEECVKSLEPGLVLVWK
jgi:hypothetical protein